MVLSLRFVGIDLAWKVEPPVPDGTGYCVLDRSGRMIAWGLLTTDQEILDLIGDNDVWVGFDASLRIPDKAGLRSCERELSRRRISVLPTDRSFYQRHYGGCRGENLASILDSKGFEYFGQGSKAYFEVYPYALILEIARGDVPRFKRGRARARAAEAERMLRLLIKWEPRLDISIEALIPKLEEKGTDDKVDALLCATSLYRHWLYSGRNSQVVGEGRDGYILLSVGEK